jgi:anti-anti-sigma regulatory factor
MLRIRRSANGHVVYTLSGRIDQEYITELETLIRAEANGRRIALDLTDVTLVDHNAVTFLDRCEVSGTTLKNCPAYIREWITRQRSGS